MAIGTPVVLSQVTGISTQTYQTSFSTLSANQLGLLCIVSHNTNSGTPPFPNLVHTGLTLVSSISSVFVDTGTQRSRVDVWRMMFSVDTASIITIGLGSASCILEAQWIGISGLSTAGSNGASALSQPSAFSGTGASSVHSVTIPASFATTGNGTFAFFGARSAGTLTPSDNFTLVSRASIAGQSANMLSMWTSVNYSNATIGALQNNPFGAFMCELVLDNAAAGTSTTSFLWANAWDVRPFQAVA